MSYFFNKFCVLCLIIACGFLLPNILLAAKLIDLRQSPRQFNLNEQDQIVFKETHRTRDRNLINHIRVQEYFASYKVWGAVAILHTRDNYPELNSQLNSLQHSKNFANGKIYLDLAADLNTAPPYLFTDNHIQKVASVALNLFQQTYGATRKIQKLHSERQVYVDKKSRAHWVYAVSFYSPGIKALPANPTYLIDALTYKVYELVDGVKTLQSQSVLGGGYGGNIRTGKIVYDKLPHSFSPLAIDRDDFNQTCFLKNNNISIVNYYTRLLMSYPCKELSSEHKVYWGGGFDAVNGGFSPANDALFAGQIVQLMYKNWYNLEVLINPDGSPMPLQIYVHEYQLDDACWFQGLVVLGDGFERFYPLTSVGIIAHEVSHGFTEQNSGLYYRHESGGINESFSDMAAQAAEYFAYGKSSWLIGHEILKDKDNKALRYMEKPSWDCVAQSTSRNDCSIDDANQYYWDMPIHHSSGVYNRFFYLLANTTNWNPRKAFEAVLKANQHYWTSQESFVTAACGVLQATQDLGYEVSAVRAAFEEVKVHLQGCKLNKL